jgi:hypothetical protein
MVATAFFVGAAIEVAVKVTVAGFGTVAGAEYVMGTPEALVVAERVPQALPVQPLPASVQLTPRWVQSW